MNYEEAKQAQPLAQPVVKVLERLEVECPSCKGKGWKDVIMPDGRKSCANRECNVCNSLRKIPYTHTPQVGEWCIYNEQPWLIIRVISNQITKGKDVVVIRTQGEDFFTTMEYITPILDWEVIEGILEKAGYECNTTKSPFPKCRVYKMGIRATSDYLFTKQANSRQLAVMKAVIELGKEI